VTREMENAMTPDDWTKVTNWRELRAYVQADRIRVANFVALTVSGLIAGLVLAVLLVSQIYQCLRS
jgi:hypothetical protein